MLSKEDNELLTRTGPGTPMGELMRRYWMPAFLSEELSAPDCPPIQVRLLGEELVAFRDSTGRIGLIDEHCSHRGTSLFYGRNEECGLRCIYHGWKYDIEGHVLDTPTEAAESPKATFKDKLLHRAYPTHEAAGMVFAYMGPKDKMPLFPNYSWASVPLDRCNVTKSLQDCNYLQGVEGECDSSHLTFLHRFFDIPADSPRMQPITEYQIEEADFGMRLIALRDVPGGKTYVRISSLVLPVDCWIPAGETGSIHFYAPASDDEHSWRYNFNFRGRINGMNGYSDRDQERFYTDDYRKVRNFSNYYLQDREEQKHANFCGMGPNFVIHDSCATESMGPIFDRGKEHLGVSDKAVIAVRRYLLDTVRAFQNGEEPPNLITDPDRNHFPHVDTFAKAIEGGDWHNAFPYLTASAGQSLIASVERG